MRKEDEILKEKLGEKIYEYIKDNPKTYWEYIWKKIKNLF